MNKAEYDGKMFISANSKKLALALLAAAFMLCGSYIVAVGTESADAIVMKGDTGEIHQSWNSGDCVVTYDSHWIQDKQGLVQYGDGILKVSGHGRMGDYFHVDHSDCTTAPWDDRIRWQSPYFGCNKLIIEEGVTHIGSCAFYTFGYTEVVIPSTVTSIGDNAFERSDLKSIVIPDTVTKMGDEVFKDCTKLTSVKLPNGIKELGKSMFVEAPIKNIEIPASVQSMNGTFQFSGIESVIIPEGVREIGDKTFWCCKNLKKVVIPDSVKSIGDYAFERSAITEIRLDNVESIGLSAFQECKALKCAILSPNLKSVGDNTFEKCSSLEYAYIPDTLKTIPDFMFAYCSSLKSIVLPDSIETIGPSAFGNTGLEYVNIPNSVKTIEHSAFSGTSLTSVVIPASVKSIGFMAFGVKTLKYVSFEGTDVDIGFFGFLAHLEIFNAPPTTDPDIGSKSLSQFGTKKFYDTDKTTEIPSNMGSIGGYTWTTVGMTEKECAYKIPDPKPETLTFTWMNYDGAVLQKASGVPLNEWPSYEGKEPVNKYGLKFCGWSSVQDRYGNVFLMAKYQPGDVTGVGGDDGMNDGRYLGSFEKINTWFVKTFAAKAKWLQALLVFVPSLV